MKGYIPHLVAIISHNTIRKTGVRIYLLSPVAYANLVMTSKIEYYSSYGLVLEKLNYLTARKNVYSIVFYSSKSIHLLYLYKIHFGFTKITIKSYVTWVGGCPVTVSSSILVCLCGVFFRDVYVVKCFMTLTNSELMHLVIVVFLLCSKVLVFYVNVKKNQ